MDGLKPIHTADETVAYHNNSVASFDSSHVVNALNCWRGEHVALVTDWKSGLVGNLET